MKWRVPTDLVNLLRVTASRTHWIDTRSMKALKITPSGRNLVIHDLPAQPKAKRPRDTAGDGGSEITIPGPPHRASARVRRSVLRNRLHDPRWIPRWAPVRDRRIQAEGHEELADATLLLAHSAPGGVSDHQLARDLEQSRLANYRRVLDKLHSARKIEYTKATGLLAISPSGIRDVEKWLLPER
jgi:hypothetical protein